MASITPKTLIHPPLPTFNLNRHSFSSFKLRATQPMSSESTQRMFQLKLDPLTGNSEWVVIDEDDDSSCDRPSAVDLATTSYLDMLNDSRRNKAYRLAIEKTVTHPCHVLDIGAGTGLLSMMAARAMGLDDQTTAGDSVGRVTACESYLPMVKLMRKVLRSNGMERKIKVINKRSDELKVGVDINSRADILVSEILDSEFFGEGLIPTLQNAHDELLVENPQTVPYRATTYGQLVESTFLWRLHDLYSNEVGASDGICLVPTKLGSILSVKRRQYPMHCHSLQEEIKLLSEPFKIFEFDFWKRPDSHEETEVLINAIDGGRVNAVISWWVLQLDQEGKIFYSTAPRWIKDLQTESLGDGNWCDHWKQCIWFVPGKGLAISKDENVHLRAVHSEISISYDLKVRGQRTDSTCGLSNEDIHLTISPEKIARYSDKNWRHCVLSAVQNALHGKNSPLCFIADDSIFLATAIAHLCGTSEILLLFPGLRGKGLQYMQAIAEANGFSVDRLKLLNHRKHSLTMHDTDDKKVDLFVAEPFYYGCDMQLPWQNLRFWKERTGLGELLSEDAQFIPCKGILRATTMFLPDLWRSRRSLEKIEGFDHSVVNAILGACGNSEGPIFPFFVWQCGLIKELSETFTLMEFDFSKPMSSCSGKAKVEFVEPGICHGLVLWIDWVLDEANGIVVSTGPDHRHWKQGVKLFPKPVAVVANQVRRCSDEFQSLEIEAMFDSTNGDVMIQHTFVQ